MKKKKKKKLLPRKTPPTKNRTTLPVHLRQFLYYYLYYYLSISILLYYLRIKGQSGTNTTLTSTKTLPKKQGYSPVDFQIDLSTYKLNFQSKNYIYKIKTLFFCYKIGPLKKKSLTYKLKFQNKNYIYKIKTYFFLLQNKTTKKKKPHRTREARVMRLVLT